MKGPLFELDRGRVEVLLERLNLRLQARGIAATTYVVGGAAIALTVADSRRTADVDALVSDDAVFEEPEHRLPRRACLRLG